MSRWIRVDDFDTRIDYSSYGWSASQLSGVTVNDYDFFKLQDAFLGTAHIVVGTDFGTQSSFSFAFNGTAVAVYGMFVGLSSACLQNCTDTDVRVPTWTCTIDGVSIPSNDAFGHFPWQSYCEQDNLADGLHEINVQIFHRNVSQPSGFYLDFIQYLPGSSSLPSDLEQGYLVIDSTDPQIPFGKEWASLGTSNMTMNDGEFSLEFTLEFTGVWLAWYSLSSHAISTLNPDLLKNETVNGGVLCQYTVDGRDPISFMMSIGPDTLTPNTYNSIMLQTATLPAGKHNITVSGWAMWHPTTLDYLIVQQSPSILDAAASSITSSTASSPTSLVDNSTHHRPINVGAIVGGTISGVLLMIALIIYLMLFYKRRISRATDIDSVLEADPLPGTIKLEPFRDSVEKQTATAPSGGSESPTLVATTLPSLQPKKPSSSRLRSSTAISITSSSNSPLPLNPPIPPTLENTIDPFFDPDFFKPSNATQSTLSLNISDAQASTTSIHSHSRLLPSDEVSEANAHPPSLAVLNDSSQPPQINPQESEITQSHNPEELVAVLNTPRPSQQAPISQSTPVSSSRRFSRIVRHADSGIRLTRTRHSENILELPPEYTME